MSGYLHNKGVDIESWMHSNSYKTHGAITTFLRSISYVKVDKSEGYSPDRVRSIAQEYKSDSLASADKEDLPNVIIVVDEAFSELKVLGDFETNRDYMPVFNSLKDNCVKGYYYASLFGGGTARTEFELLTSCTMGFLPPGTQLFELYIRNDLPAFPSSMVDLGYDNCSALHPCDAENYNRIEAYPSLGFKDFISIEDLPENMETVHNEWPSDKATFDYIIQEYEKSDHTRPFFMYDLTMQNHSPYRKAVRADEPVVITDSNKDKEAEGYLNLIAITDEALGGLTDYFRNVDKPTIILFMGDHQPRIPDEFIESVTDGESKNWGELKWMARYKTPFLIWANYDIDEEIKETSANYLQNILMDAGGLPKSGYQKYMEDLSSRIVWINALGYMGSDGNYYKFDDES